MDRHAQGVLLIVISAIAFSSAGFFTRLIHLDVWSMLFWRGLFAGLMILCVIIVQERRRTMAAIKAVGRPGLAAAICSTAATFLYINALRRTSVADVAVIFAAAPFLTAGLGWLWLRLTVDWTTLGASLLALLGIGIMVGGAAIEGHLFGDLLAFGMTVCMAIMMLIIRRHEHTPMLPAACLSALLCPLVLWPFCHPFALDAGDMVNLFLFGTTQFGLGLLLLTVGGPNGLRHRERIAQHAGNAAGHCLGLDLLRRDARCHQCRWRHYRRRGRRCADLVRQPVGSPRAT